MQDVNNEFLLGERRYKMRKISTFEAMNLARKLVISLGWLSAVEQAPYDEANPEPLERRFAKAMAASLSSLDNADVEFAVNLCLSTVTRLVQGSGWVPVIAAKNTLLDEISLDEMMLIVWHVLKYNGLIDFFSSAPSKSIEQ